MLRAGGTEELDLPPDPDEWGGGCSQLQRTSPGCLQDKDHSPKHRVHIRLEGLGPRLGKGMTSTA